MNRYELESAVKRSQRVYSIPEEASAASYELVYELFDRLERLTASEVDLIWKVLQMHTERIAGVTAAERRLAQADKVWRSNSVP